MPTDNPASVELTMTYEDWCANAKVLLKECDTYNKWRRRAMLKLLTNLAPRVAVLRNREFEAVLGRAITGLAKPYQWSASHYGKIPNDRCDMVLNEVIVTELFNDVAKYEKAIAKNSQKGVDI